MQMVKAKWEMSFMISHCHNGCMFNLNWQKLSEGQVF